MSDQDIYVRRILEAVNKIVRYAKTMKDYQDFNSNDLIYDAIIMNLVIVAEAEEKLSETYKQLHNNIDWKRIRSYRQNLSNIHLGLDKEGVWNVVKTRLPEFKRQLETVLV